MKPISLIVYDFDGVLTDNRVWVDASGNESVACNRGDGWWMGEFKKLGIKQHILSTETNPVVSTRAKKLDIGVSQAIKDKKSALLELMKLEGVDASRVCYIGNDMNDLPAMEVAGIRAAPNDAHPKILSYVDFIIPEKGGYGIVRHLYDWILNDQIR